MHFWGDGFKYFREVGEAADFIGDYCRKWGRIGVTQTKEKFGTARVYCSFGIDSFHDLTHPGYHYIQYSKLPSELNTYFCNSWFGIRFFKLLNKIIIPYQEYIYRKAYHLAFKKWPLIKEEIIDGADYPEFVSPYWESISLCSKHAAETRMGCRLDSENCLLCAEEKNEKTN